MTKQEALLRVREKLTKLHVYNTAARVMWGEEIAKDMYLKDLDFYTTLIELLAEPEDNS